jgi:hypothetical protein
MPDVAKADRAARILQRNIRTALGWLRSGCREECVREQLHVVSTAALGNPTCEVENAEVCQHIGLPRLRDDRHRKSVSSSAVERRARCEEIHNDRKKPISIGTECRCVLHARLHD